MIMTEYRSQGTPVGVRGRSTRSRLGGGIRHMKKILTVCMALVIMGAFAVGCAPAETKPADPAATTGGTSGAPAAPESK